MKNNKFLKLCSMFVFALLCTLSISSCRTISTDREVPVHIVQRDTVRVHSDQRDSVFLRDSIYVERFTLSDTVYITTYKERTKYQDVVRYRDSIVVQCDSIEIPVRVTTVQRERYTPPFVKFLAVVGALTLVIAAFFIFRFIQLRW